ncbi:tyrosine-type recombinase/integrase [Alkalihalobacillus sp. MEB130]|uniref:tyrosine-type recombinase/integrase n=1 Tax=Alkalihalobacillus sp. MEB130 TaxID=2976704 RepID=UPI0028E09482|nr:tyrosine-type recombinase/integrase [Alkalihalobacillus sp. MEB130]MDT8859036.1 tyrosine-type recombinase/integrase [Alkalihalobacillus sp. MEB130]
MQEQSWLDLFITYLQLEKNSSIHTMRNYANDISDFEVFMKDSQVFCFSDVTVNDVETYIEMLERKYSNNTILRKISTLRSFYRFHMEEGRVHENVFSSLTFTKNSERIPTFFNEKEIMDVLQSLNSSDPIDQRDCAIIELLYATGMKVSECKSIQLGDIDFSIGTVLIDKEGRNERYSPLGAFALDVLQKYINHGRMVLAEKKSQPNGSLFLNFRGGALSERSIRAIIHKRVEKVLDKKDFRPNDVRHSLATHLMNNGANIRIVRELLGHKQFLTTQQYTHVSKDRLQDVYKHCHPRA